MTFEEATALQPAWVGIWLNILLFGAFILPVALLFWKESRITGIVTLVSSALSAAGVIWIFNELGYVKLMGLSHIIFWTPLVFFLFSRSRQPEMPIWPRRILWFVMATIVISLAFDYVDVARYFLGEREPFVG